MNILILGGSEFMGKILVEKFLTQKHNVYMVNRGRKYWNTEMKLIEGINYYYGDRNNFMEFQKLIIYI